MITSLLVANRGEIAVRIMATAAVLGVRTVAVHPDDDADGLHVRRADAAVRLEGIGPRAYLDVDAVVAAAVGAGCDAVHPGYGFLSENPALARACADAGLVFVGPSADALALFGDKTAARTQAESLGIRVPRATTVADARSLLADGPVLVKAVGGGGGRGLRPVLDADGLDDAVRRATSEAAAAFGDDRVYVEQLLPHARHIEVQVLGDGTGVVVLGDRDCSVQRRRQKLIELAPAPALADDLRAALHADAARLVGSVPYRGLATVEFLVAGDRAYFLEVNPRLQVEHTVTEAVTGLDLVEQALRVASGETLPTAPPARGAAVQVRVNAETLHPDGEVEPSAGTLARFAPPSGPGVRVDTHGYEGYALNPRYDSLLAKVVTHAPTLAGAIARASRALDEFGVDGVATGIPLLQALLGQDGLPGGGLDTAWLDEHLTDLVADVDTAGPTPPEDDATVTAHLHGTVVSVSATVGDAVARGAELAVLEAMKMEHVVRAAHAGVVTGVGIAVGDTVTSGTVLVRLAPSDADDTADADAEVDLDAVRPDLAEALERHRVGLDDARPEAVGRIHDRGRRTARENIADLVDDGSLVEYGALTIAGQRQRRSLDDLIARTPADGLVMGTATVGGVPIAVMSYDYSVMAGTQGIQNHRKTDRLFDLAARRGLPLVMFVEGGGGRPGDTDTYAVAQLEVPTFRSAARLAGLVPTVAVVSGYCFAGNAALAGSCDVIIATEDASLGMGGPAMIEGGGLGVVAPQDVGPMSVQVANGVVDVLVADDAAAVAAARDFLGHVAGRTSHEPAEHADQRTLRHLIPENRLRSYDVAPVVDALFDTGSVLELRPEFGIGVRTYLARLDGRSVAVVANNPLHLGGAIDADAADKAARFLTLAQERGLAVVSLVDTPGFMVGPDAERTGTVRRFGAMFVAGARLSVPLVAVVLRKGYGLGAMAMAGGSLHAPLLTVAWPTGEFGGMGLEGAVRLGYRKDLEAIADPDARRARYDELVAAYYERGKAVSMASAFEIDDVIDPADTRRVLTRALRDEA